jgi:stage III sporulation protein AE
MKKLCIVLLAVIIMAVPASALDIEPPDVPDSGEYYMPPETESFGEGLWYVITMGVKEFLPEIYQAAGGCLSVFAVMLLASVLHHFPGVPEHPLDLAATIFVGIILLKPAHTLIQLGVETVVELGEYGKLLVPVLTGALAAQGGVTSAGALFAATTFFSTLLSSLITKVAIPMLYVYFCLSLISAVAGEEMIEKLQAFLKWLITWSMKIVLYAFTGFISITGVVSGTADASAVKAIKLTLSGAVPVVGGVISEASETILVSAGVLKNAAGVYGILAMIAVCIGPFVKIGVQYLLLKLTAGIGTIFGAKKENKLLSDVSSGMGMLLAMTGIVCLLLLVSTVCFMKGMS